MYFIVLLVSSAIVGGWVLRPAGFRSGIEATTYRFLIGLTLCAVAMLVIGSWSLPAAGLFLFVPAIGWLMVEWRRATRPKSVAALAWDNSRFAEILLDRVEWLSVLAAGAALLLALFSALAPATSWDACVAHLALPASYVREGRFMLFEGNAYSAYPHLLHCLYTVAFLSGETSAQLLSWFFAMLTCAAAYGLGRRLDSRRCGLIAAAIFATAPVFMDQAGVASLDLAFACMTLAALNAFLAWRQEGKAAWLLIAAFLAGSACGIRHTGYLVCALLSLAALAPRPADARTGRVRAFLCFGIVAVLGAGPWLLRSAVLVGNPVYPFLAKVLSPGVLPDAEITSLGAHESIRGLGLLDLAAFPWTLIVHPERYDGWAKSPGGLVLALGLPGLIVGGKRARWLGAFSGAGMACMFCFQQYARYMLPFLAPMMVVAAVAACRMTELRRPVAVLLAVSYAFGLVLALAAVHFKIPVALGFERREDYLTRRVERYPAFAWVNEHIGGDGVVLTLDPRSYYLSTRTYQNPESLKLLIGKPFEDQLDWLRSRGIQYVFAPQAYLNETPGFGQVGLLGMYDQWWASSSHFVPIRRMELPRPRGGGMETVSIYEIHHDKSDRGAP